ncbi:AAA family ATPase [Shewanella xiamenensis]|uniref:McrB family protein n=1 Tax=Shewanella xiamenensis TaxID=332186 RepID=UPI00313AA5BD
MSETIQGYSLDEIDTLSDWHVLEILKAEWDYGPSESLTVIGRLTSFVSVSGENKKTLFTLENMRHGKTGQPLSYPVEGAKQTVFIGPLLAKHQKQGLVEGALVKVATELSPKNEREKYSNPFSLCAVRDELELLQELPQLTEPVIDIDDKKLVEQWVIDLYHQKNRVEIATDAANLRAELERNQQESQRLNELNSRLAEQCSEKTSYLQQTDLELKETVDVHRQAIETLTQQRKSMEQQLESLQKFIDQKAKLLEQLDLVEPEWLYGHRETTATANRECHSFEEVFAGDHKNALSYIQAFMHNKGIYYRRKVLEDFYALVSTHDLIILAGDSGAGKTNLVKSFAEAIGGKAIIVPVKPNWTSAEDLLGYYNPLDQKYLSTPFLEAMLEAAKNPDIPYFICLDEMNLARVEYYFADFLSLLEERSQLPEIPLYSNSEETHLVSEARNFLALIDDAKSKLNRPDIVSFLDLLRDEAINAKLHELCGFREGDSLLKYHGQLRKLLSSYLTTPSKLTLPINVRIIGAINVDETTHYLSPKILDRAHIMRFGSPLLSNWDEIDSEIDSDVELDLSLPVYFSPLLLGQREVYPEFDRKDSLVLTLVQLTRGYLEPLGIEFGLRTVRQARNYQKALEVFGHDESMVLNNIVLHKVLPKLMFDGEKQGGTGLLRKDILIQMRGFLAQRLGATATRTDIDSCVSELDRVIEAAKANDWAVNYWSR